MAGTVSAAGTWAPSSSRSSPRRLATDVSLGLAGSPGRTLRHRDTRRAGRTSDAGLPGSRGAAGGGSVSQAVEKGIRWHARHGVHVGMGDSLAHQTMLEEQRFAVGVGEKAGQPRLERVELTVQRPRQSPVAGQVQPWDNKEVPRHERRTIAHHDELRGLE